MDGPFDLLDVAAGFEVLVALPVEGGPVVDAAEQAADVDEVEVGGWVDPFAGHVVDFEAAVVGLHARLYGGEVGADDFGVGEFVGYVCSEGQGLDRWRTFSFLYLLPRCRFQCLSSGQHAAQ